jgi:hypothetical protein
VFEYVFNKHGGVDLTFDPRAHTTTLADMHVGLEKIALFKANFNSVDNMNKHMKEMMSAPL